MSTVRVDDASISKLRQMLLATPDVNKADVEKLTDRDLERFIVARQNDLAKAKQMLVEYFAFRREWKLDDRELYFVDGRPALFPIRGYGPLVKDSNVDFSDKRVPRWNWLSNHGGGCWHKFDKEGRPLVIELPGRHDAKGFHATTPPNELMEWHLLNSEALLGPLMEFSEQRGNPDSQLTALMDVEGLGFHQLHTPALQLLKTVTDCDQRVYPERLNQLFVVNAPYVFTLIWRVLRGWLDKRVQEKVHILGGDYQKILLQHIPAENLPARYGGKCTCSHMEGGCVPKLFTEGHGRRTSVDITTVHEDEEEELELITDSTPLDYHTHSVHSRFAFNLEIIEEMLDGKGKAVATFTFVAEEPLAVEVTKKSDGSSVLKSSYKGGKTSRFSFPVPTEESYDVVWTRADPGTKDGEFDLKFGVLVKE